jgi:hypothetical protein
MPLRFAVTIRIAAIIRKNPHFPCVFHVFLLKMHPVQGLKNPDPCDILTEYVKRSIMLCASVQKKDIGKESVLWALKRKNI